MMPGASSVFCIDIVDHFTAGEGFRRHKRLTLPPDAGVSGKAECYFDKLEDQGTSDRILPLGVRSFGILSTLFSWPMRIGLSTEGQCGSIGLTRTISHSMPTGEGHCSWKNCVPHSSVKPAIVVGKSGSYSISS